MKTIRQDHLSIIKRLLSLNEVPDRNSASMEIGRKLFLNQAHRLRNQQTAIPTSNSEFIGNPPKPVLVPFHPRFAPALIAGLFIFFILTGGGITLAAAQNSQPDSPIYAAKILREDIQLAFATDAADRTLLSLQFSQTRADELEQLLMKQKTPSEKVLIRYERQLTRLIYNALQLQDDEAVKALVKVREQLQIMDQRMLQLSASASPENQESINRLRIMLTEKIQWAVQGIENPSQIRWMIEWQYRNRNQEMVSSATLPGTSTPSNTNTHQPQSSQTQHPNPTWYATRTPMGPGPNPSASPENTPKGPGPNPNPEKTKTPQGPGATPTPKESNTPRGPGPQGTNRP